MTEMLEIYNKVIFEVFTILKKDNKCCKIDFPIGRGSSFEDLKVVEPDEFDVLIPLKITETNKLGGIQRFVNKCDGDYKLNVSTKGPAITLHVHDVSRKLFSVDVVPLVRFAKYLLIAKPPKNILNGDGNWRRKSFSGGERYCAMSLPIEAKKILKITKAIKLNLRPTPMDTVPSYIYKTAMTHWYYEEKQRDIQNESMSKNLSDFLIYMSKILFSGDMLIYPYLDENFNVLEPYKEEALKNLARYLKSMASSESQLMKAIERRVDGEINRGIMIENHSTLNENSIVYFHNKSRPRPPRSNHSEVINMSLLSP
ncbi:hypothetical protein CAPTEDRAFT_199948 [Capitella teleta]|uniref:Uncharacterized protein n=1 Tax=Capitella teleta TaxID=283909 RepID=R7U2B9_CAPTE|nr:hypothetical protein CAPTEDRAFT_199948 [Capitella teleta]|eukprot:ELT97295.1 hypothetical protein CAPTEDRAFT_199948 [Capitella teleta]